MRNDLLTEFSSLIIELNKLAPDIAELELRNNLDASRRVVNGLRLFETTHLEPFRKKMHGIRSEILSGNRNKKIINQQTNKQ